MTHESLPNCFMSNQLVSLWNIAESPLAPSTAAIAATHSPLRRWHEGCSEIRGNELPNKATAPRQTWKRLRPNAPSNGKEVVMVRQRVRKMLPTLGILLYVMLSVFFGSLWFAALSLGMTMLQR
jgi:hypothetical protein